MKVSVRSVPSRAELILASIIFQLIWFIIVWGHAVWGQTRWLIGLWSVLGLIIIGLWRYRVEKVLIGRRVLAMGLLMDAINLMCGVLVFDSPGFPGWLAALWVGFACYAGYVMQALSHWPLFRVVGLGAFSGMLSYYAGMKLGAVAFSYSLPITLSVLFAEWGLITYAIFKINMDETDDMVDDPR